MLPAMQTQGFDMIHKPVDHFERTTSTSNEQAILLADTFVWCSYPNL